MKNGTNETVAQADSIAAPKPVAAPIVTDTLRNDNRLFDMAQRHYGDQAFWVYIALENQQQFPDYHKIPKGTAVVIPPAEKYGINSDSKQSIKKANADALKLYKEVKASASKSQQDDTTATKLPLQNSTNNKGYKSSHKQHYSRHYSSHKRHRYRRR